MVTHWGQLVAKFQYTLLYVSFCSKGRARPDYSSEKILLARRGLRGGAPSLLVLNTIRDMMYGDPGRTGPNTFMSVLTV